MLPLDWKGPVDRPFTPFSEDDKARPVVELLRRTVERAPARVALLDGTSSLTYAELWREVTAWAQYIESVTAPGELVGIVTPTALRFPIAMFACLAAGRAFVALDPQQPQDWLARTLSSARSALLLTVDETAIRVHQSAASASSPELNEQARAAPLDVNCTSAANRHPALMTPDEPACVLYTSGSTGQPKGIVNSQRNLLQRVAQSINAAHLTGEDRLLTLASPCTIVGVRDALTAVLAGASLFVLDPQKSSAAAILRIIDEHRITILFAFPALLRSLVQGTAARPAEHLRLVRIGGDTTLCSDIEMLRAWLAPPAHIQLIYAATEAPMLQWFVTDLATRSPGQDSRIPIGYRLPGNELTIVDEAGLPVRQGVAGELVVRSRYVALGVWEEGRCKTEGVRVDPLDPTQRIWRSGDLARERADGLFERLGRKDRQVKVRGMRVELEGVEAAIRRHPQIRDVGVVVHSDASSTRLVALIEWQPQASAQSLSELRHTLSQSLPFHMQPWRLYAVAAIPRLPSSKLDVRALQALATAQLAADAPRLHAAHAEVAGRTALIAHHWCKVLGVSSIAAEDDFFALGGDSLRAMLLLGALSKVLGWEVPPSLINRAPTFAAFCAEIRVGPAKTRSPLVVIKPGREALPLFLIHGVSGSVMELFPLGRSMTWPGAVIGIQAQGCTGRSAPYRTVEAMAGEYLAAVKAHQPCGPYLLCGYSFGGSVALELARQLRAGGDEVAFLGLLDALPPANHLLRIRTWTAYLWRALARRIAVPDRPRADPWAVARARWRMLGALRASVAYRPHPYAGEVVLFQASRHDRDAQSLASRWSKYASRVHPRALSGGHTDILSGPGAVSAARLLTQCLEVAVQPCHGG